MPIRRVLIANRGEIAVRIARSCHRMGISTVGVYSEPDRNALHVDVVDVAVALGGSTPAESYLRADAIIEAARSSGADAIHPGYGFLAENAEFAQAVIEAGLVWIGPTPDQIRLLGDKVAAKRAAAEAGVPTTDIVEVVDGRAPAGLTMPVLVKAAAGGGGRGMRIVHTEAELGEAIDGAAREAAAAFGDGSVFIEPYIARGRHVEVQILADSHGNVVHLGDRECSVQRRNQKVVEEAPAPRLSAPTRRRLHEGALALARHVGYVGAGTVEFMVGEEPADDGAHAGHAGHAGPGDPDGPGGHTSHDGRTSHDGHTSHEPTITFLEVNTRLQVEHPVTEAVTGIDLVAMQIEVAAGLPLPFDQHDIAIVGSAIEVRLVAEDPAAGWLPSTGELREFDIDDLDGTVRVDTGVRAGSTVSSDYDSLLAKVITHHADREIAARRIERVMHTARVVGVRTNATMLAATMADHDFLAGRTFTSYLAEHPEVVGAGGPTGHDRAALVVAATFADERARRESDLVTGFAPSGWRNLRTRGQRRRWIDERTGEEVHVEYVVRADHAEVLIGPWPEPDPGDGSLPEDDRTLLRAALLGHDRDELAVEIDGRRHLVTHRAHTDDLISVSSAAGTLALRRPPRFADHDAEVAGGGPICPLPGTVIAVHVDPGQHVEADELLMVVEAMKMEHRITAASAGLVAEVRFGVGDRVDSGDLLVSIVNEESA